MGKSFPTITTPGPEQANCWACGTWTWTQRGYCKPCTLKGLDSPMISCQDCGDVRRRRAPGEQSFVCSACRTIRTRSAHGDL